MNHRVDTGLVIAAVALAVSLGVASCTPAQVQTAQTTVAALQIACTEAQAAGSLASGVVKGGAANTVATINSYVTPACATTDAIAKLAADPSSLAWIGQQTGALKTLAAVAK